MENIDRTQPTVEPAFFEGIQAVVNLLAEAEQHEAIQWIRKQYLQDKLQSYRYLQLHKDTE